MKVIMRVWLVVIKICLTLKNTLKLLRPDKTFASRLCFIMAFVCCVIFIIHALFVLGHSGAMLLAEIAHRGDKELKMAQLVCNREQAKSDTVMIDAVFKMMQNEGIDKDFILCVVDSTDSIRACSDKQWKKKGIKTIEKGTVVTMESYGANVSISTYDGDLVQCLSAEIEGAGFDIVLVKPCSIALQPLATVGTDILKSSFWCFAALVFCYLMILYMMRKAASKSEQMQNEMDVAGNIQQQMIPSDFSMFPGKYGYNLKGFLLPAKAMGGDIFDFVVKGDKLFFCLGDVSGKGMPAALFMSEVHILFRHVIAFAEDISGIASAINNSVAQGNDSNMFCTMFLGVIDMTTNQLTFCNAGHNPPVVIDSEGNTRFLDVLPNLALGLFEDFPYQMQTMTMEPGMSLFCYTDGITEAENLRKQLYSDEKVLQVLSGCQNDTPAEVIDRVLADVREHTVMADQSDDITMLCVKFQPNN